MEGATETQESVKSSDKMKCMSAKCDRLHSADFGGHVCAKCTSCTPTTMCGICKGCPVSVSKAISCQHNSSYSSAQIILKIVIMLGGILAVAGAFKLWQIGVYAIVISLLIFVFEYPRGKRRKGKTVERRFQKYLTLMVSRLGPLSRNYYIRFILYSLFCAPCCFILPTLLGAICLIITSIVYLVAAIKGEEWRPVEAVKDSEQEMTETSMAPPSYPPPRTPPISQRQGVQTRSQRAKAATNRV